MTVMLPTAQYAETVGLSLRQVQRYLTEDRLPGASKVGGKWLIPADSRPVEATSGDVVLGSIPTPSYDVVGMGMAPVPHRLMLTLEEAASLMDLSVVGVRMLADLRPDEFVVGRFGPHGALRVWVA